VGPGIVGVGHRWLAAVGPAVIVEPVAVRRSGTDVERSTVLHGRFGEHRLVVRGPKGVVDGSTDASSPTAAALAFAMRHEEELRIDGPVDPVLRRALDEIQAAYLAWDRQASPVAVDAPQSGAAPARRGRRRPERRPRPRRAAFFSRGVDSLFTAARDRAGATELDALVFVDGLEPRHDEAVRAEELRLATAAAGRLGLPLVAVETNVRELFDPAGFDWEDAVGAGLASVALALAGGFDEVVIPSGDSYATVEPCGTSPLLDPLFSTSRVRVVHDSLAHSRLGKVGWLVAHRPDLLGDIKVCFKENRADNCGRCGKCLLTMACLQAHGALDRATAFSSPIDPDDIRAFRLPTAKARADWAEVARALDPTGPGGEVRAAALDTLRTSVLTTADRVDHDGNPVWSAPYWLRNHRLNEVLSLVVDGEPYPPLES